MLFGGLQYIFNLFLTDPAQGAVYLLSRALAVCVAISFHEWAHAFVAWRLGDPTAKNMGRMTIDPTKHINWLGMLCFVVFGFGWANPVIISSRNLKHFRRDDVLISIAGPLTNLLLAFVFCGLWFFGLTAWGWGGNETVMLVLETLFALNLSFAVFNILPIPPLDGFHVATSLFVRRNYKVIDFLNRYGFILLIVLLLTGVIGIALSAVFNWVMRLFFSFYALFL